MRYAILLRPSRHSLVAPTKCPLQLSGLYGEPASPYAQVALNTFLKNGPAITGAISLRVRVRSVHRPKSSPTLLHIGQGLTGLNATPYTSSEAQ